MSVSLTMIPVALALRVVMGKEKFNTWVESNQVPIPMNFKSRKELTTTLHKAGFDALPYGSSIKTHYEGENFFLWELREGKWTAVFSAHDRNPLIKHFIKELEIAAGRSLTTEKLEEVTEQVTSKTFPTNFTDKKMLEQTLQQENIPYTILPDGSLQTQLGATSLHFVQYQDGGIIDVKLENKNEDALTTVFQQMSVLDESYREQIQQNTYNQLVENAEKQGFFIEDETTLPDESILITLRVGDEG